MYRNTTDRLLNWLGLSRRPQIRVYYGYSNGSSGTVFGHVLTLGPRTGELFRNNWLFHAIYLVRLFLVRPYPFAWVSFTWNGIKFTTRTQDNGFFRFEWKGTEPHLPGWYDIMVVLEEDKYRDQKITGAGKLFIPGKTPVAFVSDIDDTFLVSHTSILPRKLYLLFTKSAL
ncbi:MAG: hypothetical protein KGM98_00970, partial [Bacteroidota bacterium]|nr:hypothetical protein [Bacteroidota bacterium]